MFSHSGMDRPPCPLLPLNLMARRLGVPVNWLRAEAEADRVPHLKAGPRLLFNPEAVEQVLVERALPDQELAE